MFSSVKFGFADNSEPVTISFDEPQHVPTLPEALHEFLIPDLADLVRGYMKCVQCESIADETHNYIYANSCLSNLGIVPTDEEMFLYCPQCLSDRLLAEFSSEYPRPSLVSYCSPLGLANLERQFKMVETKRSKRKR